MLFDFYRENSRYKWFKNNNFNYKKLIKCINYYNNRVLKSISNERINNLKKIKIKEVARSASFAYYPNNLKLFLARIIVDSVVMMPVLVLCILYVPEISIASIYLNSGLSYEIILKQVQSFESLFPIYIVLGVIIFTYMIFNFVIVIIIDKRKERWLDSIK